jgi:hypothetical protein
MLKSRRQFILKSLLAISSISFFKIKSYAKAEGEYYLANEYSDLISDWGNNDIILKAEDICAEKSVSNLEAHEPAHFHKIFISEAEMNKLKNGHPISIVTAEEWGHTHTIRFHPNNKAKNGTVVQVYKTKNKTETKSL